MLDAPRIVRVIRFEDHSSHHLLFSALLFGRQVNYVPIKKL